MVPCSQLLSSASGAVLELLAQHKGFYVFTSLGGSASLKCCNCCCCSKSLQPNLKPAIRMCLSPLLRHVDCCGWPPSAGGGAGENKEGDAEVPVANSPRDVIHLWCYIVVIRWCYRHAGGGAAGSGGRRHGIARGAAARLAAIRCKSGGARKAEGGQPAEGGRWRRSRGAAHPEGAPRNR